jgi:hypothetical protein
MLRNETEAQPKTISVPEAGKAYFGLSRGASYAAAANGQIPTIRVALERLLEKAGEQNGAPMTSTGPDADR